MSFPGVAVVIGSASGIGRATAILYATRGCRKIVLGDLRVDALAETKSLIQQVSTDADVLDLPCDITSESSVNEFVVQAVAKFGRIDYVCNVAGILMPGPSNEFSVTDFDKQFTVNARGTWICQRAELAQMAKQEPIQAVDDLYPQRGSIVNMSSMCGLRGFENLPSYCATKYAIIGFTKSDALRVAKDGIRINAVCPGVIRTSLLGELDEKRDASTVNNLVSDMAMGRMGHPGEVAETLLFLTSGKASLITATTLAVNGGKSDRLNTVQAAC